MEQKAEFSLFSCLSIGGVTVSIVAFQAVDPGSTPGQCIIFSSSTIISCAYIVLMFY